MKPTRHANSSAAARSPVLWTSLFDIALFAGLSVTRAQTGANADVVTAISNLENDCGPQKNLNDLPLALWKARKIQAEHGASR
jgi:hypothetical protein